MAGRIPPLPLEEAKAAARAAGIRESLAQANAIRVLLRHPDLAKAVIGQLTTLLFTGKTLDVRLRELVIMRIGWVTGAKYEWTQHWRISRDLKIPAEDLVAIRDWRNSERFSPADRAVLAAVDETLADGRISDATWAECVAHIGGEKQLIELVVAIGNWTLFSQLLRSLEIPLEDGVAGWPPDGVRPWKGDA